MAIIITRRWNIMEIYIQKVNYNNNNIKQYITDMLKKAGNYLLQKNQLGAVKKGFHSLPPQEHVYGMAPAKDKYGARQVLSGWEETTHTQSKQGGKDYITMNRQGLRQGCLNPKQIAEYRKGNERKVPVKEGQKFYGVSIPNEQFCYGISNRPSTPIKNVIGNKYAQEQLALKEEREAVMKMLEKEKKQNPKIVERSPPKKQESKLQVSVNRKKELQEHNFKLSKFKNVQSKIKPMMEKNKSTQVK